MTAAARYGEIDADAIHSMLVAPRPRRPISPGLQKRIDDEVQRVREEHDIVHRLTDLHPADPDGLVVVYQSSPAATSESAPNQMVPLLAVGAETEAPGAGIPPPRPVRPDHHFSYIRHLLGGLYP
ncbi:hypothetical protein CH300_00280 [Rhodococcus sp. 15-1154-1]|nr:hypothetical protein [Rhodococcus sp. 15-1154-1]OZF09853.1 hypothetical protein CH300_00280 [Rhodococcus sp. 15-1154-1]